MNNDKLCVIFPGVGYHKDKPLLYYASRLASKSGYDILSVEYSNLPQKIKGDADPWSDVAEVKRIAGKQNIPLHSYPDCNHSLECDDIEKNIDILKDVMNKTALFIA